MSYKIKKVSLDVEKEFHKKFKLELNLDHLKAERLILINNYKKYFDRYKKSYLEVAKDFDNDEAIKQKDISMRIAINYGYLIDEVETEIDKVQKEHKDCVDYFNLIKDDIVEKIIEKKVSE